MSQKIATAKKRVRQRFARHSEGQEAMQAVQEFAEEKREELRNSPHVLVQGFEIPKKLAVKLTDDAVWILGHIKRRGAAFIETDDSADAMMTVLQLNRIAEEGYFDIMHDRDDHIHWIIDRDRFRVNSR